MEKPISHSQAYADAGVDINAGYRAVDLMKKHVARTMRDGSIGSIGGFGGLFKPNLTGYKSPIFISGTDGVGTKIRLAQLLDKHNTVGIDCVAMCVNDIVCCGAEPQVFLDYIACGKNYPEKIAAIVEGVAEGCVRAGCELNGGETAEHPGVMNPDDYDLAGFVWGIVDESKVLKPKETLEEGDVLIALPSSGVHSNGFSLVRKVFNIDGNPDVLNLTFKGLDQTLGECLLTPTVIYVKPILELLKSVSVKGIVHVTGGGFYENIPRILPDGLTANIDIKSVRTPAIFNIIKEQGCISTRDMFNTFNMGVGMIVAVSPDDVNFTIAKLEVCGIEAYELGRLIESDERVIIRGI